MLRALADRARRAVRKVRGDWRDHPTADVLTCCPVGADVVWRIVIETRASNDPIDLVLYDRAHTLISVDPILFEDQTISCDGLLKRRITYSIRMSEQVESFTLVVQHGQKIGRLAVGFEQWRNFMRAANHLRRDAWFQPDYNEWLAQQDEHVAVSRASSIGSTRVQVLPDTHVMVYGEGIELAPQAIEIIAQVLVDHPDALAVYSDSDSIDRFGRRVRPLFKPDFSPEYLRATNYLGEFIVVRSDVYESVQVMQTADGEAGLHAGDMMMFQQKTPTPYECALYVARLFDEGKGEVLHIPDMLFHQHDPSDELFKSFTRETSSSDEYTCQSAFSKPAASLRDKNNHETQGTLSSLLVASPAVDIIIPSRDHIDVLDNCIVSLLTKATYNNCRIIIVENNSTQLATFTYYEELMQRDSRVMVVVAESSEQEGFNYARLINFGVAQGHNPYLLLLNNDTEVIEPDFIQYMLQPLQNPQVGVVGAKLFFKDGLVQHVGMLIGPDGTVVHVDQDEDDAWPGYMGRSIFPTNVSAVTGACQMMRRETFDLVGGYSEQFAVGYNDADFCCKVVRSGQRIVMQPAAKLYHFEFTSRGREENDPIQLERWRFERDLFQRTWPLYFENGDPFSNPNLDRNSRYFALPE